MRKDPVFLAKRAGVPGDASTRNDHPPSMTELVCIDCGTPTPYGGRGRPRKRCAACAAEAIAASERLRTRVAPTRLRCVECGADMGAGARAGSSVAAAVKTPAINAVIATSTWRSSAASRLGAERGSRERNADLRGQAGVRPMTTAPRSACRGPLRGVGWSHASIRAKRSSASVTFARPPGRCPNHRARRLFAPLGGTMTIAELRARIQAIRLEVEALLRDLEEKRDDA
jgi:hypothetical protein